MKQLKEFSDDDVFILLIKTSKFYAAYYSLILIFLLLSVFSGGPLMELSYKLQGFYQNHLMWVSWVIIGIIFLEVFYLLYATYNYSRMKKYLLISFLFIFVILPALVYFEIFLSLSYLLIKDSGKAKIICQKDYRE